MNGRNRETADFNIFRQISSLNDLRLNRDVGNVFNVNYPHQSSFNFFLTFLKYNISYKILAYLIKTQTD